MQIELAVSRAANILQSAAGDTVQWLFNWRMIPATQSSKIAKKNIFDGRMGKKRQKQKYETQMKAIIRYIFMEFYDSKY